MPHPIHPGEPTSNKERETVAAVQPRGLRTFTPSLAVLSRSAGIYHWTPEGRRLYDFTSGVLVSNLGHNPATWMQRFTRYLGWDESKWTRAKVDFFTAVPMTAYNAVTPVDTEASRRLI